MNSNLGHLDISEEIWKRLHSLLPKRKANTMRRFASKIKMWELLQKKGLYILELLKN